MSTLVLSPDEIEALTAYTNATKQLQVLHRRGYHRAFINRLGCVVLERAHYDAVARGETQAPTAPRTKTANLSFLRPAA